MLALEAASALGSHALAPGSGCTAVFHLLPSLHTPLTLCGAAHSLGSHSLVTAVSRKGQVLPQDEGERGDLCVSKPLVCDVPPGHSCPCAGQPFSSTAALRSRGLDLPTACIRIPWGACQSPQRMGAGGNPSGSSTRHL